LPYICLLIAEHEGHSNADLMQTGLRGLTEDATAQLASQNQ